MLILPGGITVGSFYCSFDVCKLLDPLDMSLSSNFYVWPSQSFSVHSTSPKIVICYLKTAELEFKFCPNLNCLLAINHVPFINFYQVRRQGSKQGVEPAIQKHIWESLWTLVGESHWAVNTSWMSGSFHMLKEVLRLYSSALYIALRSLSCNQFLCTVAQEHIMRSPKFRHSSCWVWHLGS